MEPTRRVVCANMTPVARGSFGTFGGQKPTLIEIREEHSGDVTAVRDVNRRAFGQD
jgi:hypothetical protein